jgi:hypothetical protein
MKNKLQRIIKHIKTMFYNLSLCVSLKKDSTNVEKNEKISKFVIFRKFKQNIKDINMGISKDIRRYLLIGLWISILFYHGYDYFILGKNYQVNEISKIIQLSVTLLITLIYLDTKYFIKIILGKNYIGGDYIGYCKTTNQGIELNIKQTLLDCKLVGRIVKSEADYSNFYGAYIKDKSINDLNEYSFFILHNNNNRQGFMILRIEYLKKEIKILGEYTDSLTNQTEKIHLKRKDK